MSIEATRCRRGHARRARERGRLSGKVREKRSTWRGGRVGEFDGREGRKGREEALVRGVRSRE